MPCKLLEASGAVAAFPIVVDSIGCEAGSDAMTVALANKATAGGTEVVGYGVKTAGEYGAFPLGPGVAFDTACYATLTGTSPKVWIVYHRPPGQNWT